MVRPKPSLHAFALLLLVAVSACLPGARAPNVAPSRTLGPQLSEEGGGTSSAAFGVVFAGPKGETTDPAAVTVVFNRPLRALELAGEEVPSPARIVTKDGRVPAGTWRWLGTNALVFAPETSLPRATPYVVTIPGTTRALDGSTLGADYSFSFTTSRPSVVHVSPGNGTTHIGATQSFELRFDQPVDPKEVARATTLRALSGAKAKTLPFTTSHPKADVPMLVKLTPKVPLPLAAPITITVDETLRGLEGPLPSGEPRSSTVHTYGPLTVSEIVCSRTERKLCSPHDSVHLSLSNRVSLADLKAHVRVEPALAIDWAQVSGYGDKVQSIRLPIDVAPAKSYRIVVTAGLKDEYGQQLARSHAEVLRTDDEPPDVTVGLRGRILEASRAKGRDLPVSSLNVERFELVSGATDELGLMQLLVGPSRVDGFHAVLRGFPGAHVEDVRPGVEKNKIATKLVSLDGLVGPNGRGLAYVGTSRSGPGKRPIQTLRWVNVTDLAISARISRFGSFVLVTRLSDGKPVGGATVAVRGEGGRELLSVVADAQGVAMLPADRFQPVKASGELDERMVLFARSGGDWTYRMASDVVYRAQLPPLDMAARMPIFGMLFTDRGIYKAGETIRLKGVFRKDIQKGMETPRNREVVIRAFDPQGGTMLEHKGKLGAFGEIAVDVPIPATSSLGSVRFEAVAEGEEPKEAWEPPAAFTSVEIAAYRPAEFKVTVDPGKPEFVRGDRATFTVKGDYLFGAPMSGSNVRYSVTHSRTGFVPPKTEEFDVDDDEYRWALSDGSSRGGKLQGGDGALDGKGVFESHVSLALPKQDGPENVTFEGEIEDLSRQTISSSATVLVHPAEFYVALKRPQNLFSAVGKPLRATVAAIEPSGKRRADVAMEVDLISRTWMTATEATGEDGVHYASRALDKVVASCQAKTTVDVVACDLVPPAAGFYIVRARAKDKRGNPVAASQVAYVSGDDASVAWPVHDGPRLELVTDKSSYEVGDVAKILVKSPFKQADALLTVERSGVLERRRVPVRGSMPTFDVPVTAEMWPNVYVSVELIKGRTASADSSAKNARDVGAPSYRIGYAEISVNPEGRRLKVDVKPSRKAFQPGDEVDVELLVTDRAGKGTKADVAFYAVDEGVLMLTGYKTPDPLPVFSMRRPSNVAPLESRDDLARIVRRGLSPGEDKGDEGGGGGDGLSARRDFRTTAFFQPSVVTGQDGKARVRFKLPDSLTTFRLMAVATSETERFGFGQESIVTSRPLMVRPALPRFLRAGDAIQAGVIVSSKGLPAQSVDVSLEAKGVVAAGAKSQTIHLPANGAVEVRWAMRAEAAGKAELAFRARASGARDDVTVSRDVSAPASLEAVALYGDTETAIAERLGDLSGMRADTGGLDLRVSSTALVGLDNGVEALLEYPYGCTEQLASKVVPLVALTDLARDYGVKLPPNTDAIVDRTIAQILAAQSPDGAFGFWPNSPSPEPWVTAHALWALHLAKERGRPVPQSAIDGATRWLRERLALCGLEETNGVSRPRSNDYYICGDEKLALSWQAFVVDVLATIGRPDAGYTSRLFARRDEMPLFARALLAHAMILTKMRPSDAAELVRDVDAHIRVTGAGATIADNLGDRYAPLLASENRTTAMVLRTLVTVDPAHPIASRLARGLLAARRGGAWRSTQENAWALLALDAYRKAQEKDAPDFDARVFFGDKQVLAASFRGRSAKTQSASFGAEKIFGRGGQNLAFEVRGKGRLYYEARLRYARSELPSAPLDRGFFVKKFVRAVRPEALVEAQRTLPTSSTMTVTAGDLVLVDLLVVTPDPREQVVVDDPLPAGLEAIDGNLATTSRDLAIAEVGEQGDQIDAAAARDIDERAAGRAFQSSWYRRENRDDRVLTFVERMAVGVHHYRYLARATTTGRFVVPPTRAECMYEPEIFGRTASTTFDVKPK